MKKFYNDYSSYIKKRFSQRVQKISINLGFSCPNRDGTKGTGGCTYCNNKAFSPAYCDPNKTITEQLNEGIAFFSKKYKTQKYLAYFQSYTNTHADNEKLKKCFNEALNHKKVVGLIIGTRPDCINEEIISFLSSLAKNYYISLEIGIESTLNRTLKTINRCHSYEDVINAFELAKNKGLYLCAHLIIGLSGETRKEMLNHATKLSKLPIDAVKLHHLQILKGTRMASEFKEKPDKFNLFTAEQYIELITEFISLLRQDIIIERFINESPKDMLIAPNWGGLKNFEIVEKINKRLSSVFN